MTYAKKTTVPVDKSRREIERTLERYGATGFAYGWRESEAMIGFETNGKSVRFVLPLPNRDDFKNPKRGWEPRPQAAIDRDYNQAKRQRWRALSLAIKAKLEMVEVGITTFEEEFLPHIVMPNGQTFAEWALPQLEEMTLAGKMPKLLPAGASQS